VKDSVASWLTLSEVMRTLVPAPIKDEVLMFNPPAAIVETWIVADCRSCVAFHTPDECGLGDGCGGVHWGPGQQGAWPGSWQAGPLQNPPPLFFLTLQECAVHQCLPACHGVLNPLNVPARTGAHRSVPVKTGRHNSATLQQERRAHGLWSAAPPRACYRAEVVGEPLARAAKEAAVHR
jgi:hypothetical protein